MKIKAKTENFQSFYFFYRKNIILIQFDDKVCYNVNRKQSNK